jgi:hypothetical protein
MNPSDAVEVHELVEGRWQATEWTAGDKRQFCKDIVIGDRQHVLAAIDHLHRMEAKDWAPTAGRILRQSILLEIDPPSWEKVMADVPEWRRVQATLPPWECPDGKCDGSGKVVDDTEFIKVSARCSCWDSLIDRRWVGLHPLIGEAVRREWLNLRHLKEAAAGNTTMASQLRKQWEEFVADVVESRLLALSNAAGIPRLERAHDETERRLKGQDAHLVGADRGPRERRHLTAGSAGRLVRQIESGEPVA